MSKLKIDNSIFIDTIKTGNVELIAKMSMVHKIDINEDNIYHAIELRDVGLLEWMFELNNKDIKFSECILCKLAYSHSLFNRNLTFRFLRLFDKYNSIKTPEKHECVFFKKIFKWDMSHYVEFLLEKKIDFNAEIIYGPFYRKKTTSIFNYALISKATKCANLIFDHYNPLLGIN